MHKNAYKGERPSRPGISIGCGGVKKERPTAVYLQHKQTWKIKTLACAITWRASYPISGLAMYTDHPCKSMHAKSLNAYYAVLLCAAEQW